MAYPHQCRVYSFAFYFFDNVPSLLNDADITVFRRFTYKSSFVPRSHDDANIADRQGAFRFRAGPETLLSAATVLGTGLRYLLLQSVSRNT